MKTTRKLVVAAVFLTAAKLHADHVILDDCIIDGSMAVGLDSVNGENFGFDTIRIKENNLRFHFDDTSVAASFPRNDWRLIANDSANGGDSYLGIEDSTGGRIPFRVEAGAGSNSLFVESTGDVGFGTNNPVVRVHLSDGDTPTVRLEQNGNSGWNPQTWDMAGNETNFFIRDVTHGSKLPFRIRPDAPTSSIEIEADGNIEIGKSVEIGTTVAEIRLSIPDDGTNFPAMKVASTIISGDDSGNGVRALFSNSTWNSGMGWADKAQDDEGGLFQIQDDNFFWHAIAAGPGAPVFTQLMSLDNGGNLDTLGTVNGASDRNLKTNIVPVKPEAMLEKVLDLPLSEWTYKRDDPAIRHVGPMAQDFRAAFGLGQDDKTISFHDPAGVALAAIQGLHKVVEEKDQRIGDLEKQNAALEARLKRIEEALLDKE